MKSLANARRSRDGVTMLMRCPECGQKLYTGPHNLGGFVRCSRCWHKFQVTAAPADSQGRSESPPSVEEPAEVGRQSEQELHALETALRFRLERIGAAAQASGDVPGGLALKLGAILDELQVRIDYFNALRESGATRRVLESVRARLARLARRRDTMLIRLGRRLVASQVAQPGSMATIRSIEHRIEALRASLEGRRADGGATHRLATHQRARMYAPHAALVKAQGADEAGDRSHRPRPASHDSYSGASGSNT